MQVVRAMWENKADDSILSPPNTPHSPPSYQPPPFIEIQSATKRRSEVNLECATTLNAMHARSCPALLSTAMLISVTRRRCIQTRSLLMSPPRRLH